MKKSTPLKLKVVSIHEKEIQPSGRQTTMANQPLIHDTKFVNKFKLGSTGNDSARKEPYPFINLKSKQKLMGNIFALSGTTADTMHSVTNSPDSPSHVVK